MRTLIAAATLATTLAAATSQEPPGPAVHIAQAVEQMQAARGQLLARCAVFSENREFGYSHSHNPGHPEDSLTPRYTPAREIYVSHYTEEKKIGYFARHQYDPAGASDGIWTENLANFKTREQLHRMTLNRNPPAYSQVKPTMGAFRAPFDSWIALRYGGSGFTPIQLLKKRDTPPIDMGGGRIKSFWSDGRNNGYMIHDSKVGYMPTEVQWVSQWQRGDVIKAVTQNVRIEWAKIKGLWLAKSIDRIHAEDKPIATREPLPPEDQTESIEYCQALMEQNNRRAVYTFTYIIGDDCPDDIFEWNIVDMRRPVWAAFGLVVAPDAFVPFQPQQDSPFHR